MGRKNLAYDYLKNMILSNKLAPNAPIREMDIANELKISRTPLREAMRELEAEGLIVSYPSQGSYVSKITPYDIEEIYELRVLLELHSLENSISRFTDDELNYLSKAFDQTYDDIDWIEYHKADRMLHQLIIEKAGNKRLVGFMNNLNAQIERVRRMSSSDIKRRESSYREHKEIINLIRNKDLQKCKVSLGNHLRSVANSSIEVIKMQEIKSNII
ncbi:GntR family transcriptional regulator [Sedimentibacter saalensis]|uniref:GntR family transcriptional regulator n=1 Tax=Sedimentibacter saalensis TaxID=130788 RepID=UPI002899A986|nr:GntR family transcriptional regulator [Sedimentibacter saalensis]